MWYMYLFSVKSCSGIILCVLGHVSMDGWRSSFLGLAAMNLAESADKLVSFEVLAEIYVSAAIQIRRSFPDGLHFIAVGYATLSNYK